MHLLESVPVKDSSPAIRLASRSLGALQQDLEGCQLIGDLSVTFPSKMKVCESVLTSPQAGLLKCEKQRRVSARAEKQAPRSTWCVTFLSTSPK